MTMTQEEIVAALDAIRLANNGVTESSARVTESSNGVSIDNQKVTAALSKLIADINEPPPPPVIPYFKLVPPLATIYITQQFGVHSDNDEYWFYRPLNGHEGTDFRAAVGTAVFASHMGEILTMGFSTVYGNNVKILQRALDPLGNERNFITHYAHLAQFADGLAVGKFVQAGEVIGISGATGRVFGAHLHYGLKISGASAETNPIWTPVKENWVNPLVYLSKWPLEVLSRRVTKRNLRIRDWPSNGDTRRIMSRDEEYDVTEERSGWSSHDWSRAMWSGLNSLYSKPVE